MLPKDKKILFLYLTGFSITGGIEKFNRSFLKALHELSVDGFFDADAYSSYDDTVDEKYFPRLRFKGFNKNRFLFTLFAFFTAIRYNTIIIGHINLAVIGCWIKKIKPKVQLITVAHGIEVWKELSGYKLALLQQSDRILCVSNYTRQQIIEKNPSVEATRMHIFPNTLDPYFIAPVEFKKPAYLLERYRLNETQPLLLTVTRLSFSERYKGYDNTIEMLPLLLQQYPNLHYLLGGKADQQETKRIKELIDGLQINKQMILPGFIEDKELIDHYLLGDVFVMPSRKEGFGIVFIEALACGRKVIAGNKDGSADALMNGELGVLVDPDDKTALAKAIIHSLENNEYSPQQLQEKVIMAFGFDKYKERLKHLLAS